MSNRRLRLWLAVALMGMFVSMPMLPDVSHAFAGSSQTAMADCDKNCDQTPCEGMTVHCPVNLGCVVFPCFLAQESMFAVTDCRRHSVYGMVVNPLHGRSIAPDLEPPIPSA